MTFCPRDGNTLLVETMTGHMRLFCPTCPYVRPITKKITRKVATKKKEADDVIGENAWASAQRTTITCEKCGNKQAFFMQIQIRSADEPMTTFYRCTNFACGFQWRDG